MEKIAKSIDVPLVANMVEGGRTPVLTYEQLEAIGYGLAIFPATAFLAAGAAMQSVYQTLLTDKSSTKVTQPLYNFQEFSKLMGFDWVSQFDQQFKTSDQ
jgi:2-methylisocitrate lyase-like PEP mutase family enzyme